MRRISFLQAQYLLLNYKDLQCKAVASEEFIPSGPDCTFRKIGVVLPQLYYWIWGSSYDILPEEFKVLAESDTNPSALIDDRPKMYTEKISMDKAIDLQSKIKAGKMPDIIAFSTNARAFNSLEYTDVNHVYNKMGKELLLTRPDYAQYIEEVDPLPEGWGYVNKPIESKIYEGLERLHCHAWGGKKWWDDGKPFKYSASNKDVWHRFCFRLEDLARVEAEPKSKTNKLSPVQIFQVPVLLAKTNKIISILVMAETLDEAKQSVLSVHGKDVQRLVE